MKRFLVLLGIIAAFVVPTAASAAVTDTAVGHVDKTVAHVGEPVTFYNDTNCTISCTATWTWDNGTRLGSRVGVGDVVSYTFGANALTTRFNQYVQPGTLRIQLALGEKCAPFSRFTCYSYTYVYVQVIP